jgi:4-amino-4-deoxy-L-arabinose transferase-like glycosyltransferase
MSDPIVNAGASSEARRALLAASLALGVALTLPRLTSFGMFVDGIYYAAIGRNLAQGLGSLWSLYVVPGHLFFEHPPAGIWLLALAHRVFGDSPLVDSFVSGAAGLVLLGLMVGVWRSLGLERFSGPWLAILLFLAVPITSWAFANNILDLYLTLATTGAIWAVVSGVRSVEAQQALGSGLLAGLLVVAAFLIKGATGLFPLVAPVLALGLVPESREGTQAGAPTRQRRLLLVLLPLAAVVLAAACAIAAYAPARYYIEQYFMVQVSPSLSGSRAHRASHLYIVLKLAKELALPAALVLGPTWWLTRRAPFRDAARREAWALLAIALSASLPVAVSPKQDMRYVLQALPLFALGLAALASPLTQSVEQAIARRGRRWLWLVAGLLVVGAAGAAASEHGRVRRPGGFYEDFVLQPVSLPAGARIRVCPERLLTFYNQAAFVRYLGADLREAAEPGGFFLTTLLEGCPVPPGCGRFHPPHPTHYVLYDCRGMASRSPP